MNSDEQFCYSTTQCSPSAPATAYVAVEVTTAHELSPRTGEENSKVPSAPWRAFKKEIGGFGGSKRERVHGTDRDGSWVS